MQEPELAQRVGAIYSYGQPRVGDAAFRDAFCSAYGDRTWRLRNAGDIVPFLLPRWLGYRCEPLPSAFIQLQHTMHQTENQVLVIKITFSRSAASTHALAHRVTRLHHASLGRSATCL